MAVIPDSFLLVLDDYHMIDARSVDNALSIVVEHLPGQMHLVITTREDPALPIPRLRARGQMTELRATDLRFTLSEAAEFLNQAMDIKLSEPDVAALETRTEGWIAGLQLAALSMRGNQDATEFIRGFTGDHRYIVDYLVEEVLEHQPEDVRNFLLQTSILDRMNGPLCEAVTSQSGGRARLQTLQQGNFFLIPLDDRRDWYRYHHLFGDVLQIHLRIEQPDQVPVLHARASEWHEQNGSAPDAIHHALAGGDFERAAGLIELAAPAMHRNRQETTVLGWIKALPEELFRARPVLSILYVGALMSNGEIDGVEARLQNAERWLGLIGNTGKRPKDMIVVNEDEFRRLPGSIAIYRAGQALALGKLSETMTHARQVLDLAPEDDHLGRGAAAALLGLALWTGGNLEAAHSSFAKGMEQLRVAGNIADAVGGVLALADTRVAQGRLHDAMHTYEKALQLARENGTPGLRGTADMYVGMSELELEHNDLQAAMQLLLRSQGQGEHTGFPQHPYRRRVALSRIRAAHGDLDGALALLDEAEPLYVSDFFPNVRPVAALKARIWLAQGRLDKAFSWASEHGLSAVDDLGYLREFEHMTLARILLVHARLASKRMSSGEMMGLLERLSEAADAGGRRGHLIEILVLQALARQIEGDSAAALMHLERAVTLAGPEGYVRTFLDEGEPMRILIEDLRSKIENPSHRLDEHLVDYADKLLDAFARSPAVPVLPIENQQPKALAPGAHRPGWSAPGNTGVQNLVEPLSQRELDILRLFRTELSGPEIAQELVIALSTVRTHTKSIYSKPGVNSRRAAVKRGIELGLI
jgi:LuxR family transcriptional regulator, maltose regulon positive regulatory protein